MWLIFHAIFTRRKNTLLVSSEEFSNPKGRFVSKNHDYINNQYHFDISMSSNCFDRNMPSAISVLWTTRSPPMFLCSQLEVRFALESHWKNKKYNLVVPRRRLFIDCAKKVSIRYHRTIYICETTPIWSENCFVNQSRPKEEYIFDHNVMYVVQ